MKNLLLRTILWIGLTLVAQGSLAASSSDQPVVLRYGDLGVTTANLYQYLAIEHGLYRKYAVDLQVNNFLKGGPEIIAAAAGGQLDVGNLGTPILTGISRGVAIRVVGSPPLKGQEFVLVGRPDIASIAALKGQLVGVSSVGGGQSQALRFILRANGLKDDEVKTIAYGASVNGYITLRSKQVAAVVQQEPEVSRAELDGSGKVLAQAADYFGRYQHSYIFASNKFIAAHPETIRNFFRADHEALLYAKNHRAELIAFGEKKLNLDAALLTKVFETSSPRWDESQAVDVEGLLNAIKIVKELGDIDPNYVPVIEKIVDPRFADSEG